MSKIINQHLNLNVSRVFQVTFQVQAIIAKGLAYFVLRGSEDTLELVLPFHQANTTSAPARGSFEHQRKADLMRCLHSFRQCA